MIQKNNVTKQPNHPATVTKPMLVGAGIGLIFISLFLSGVDDPKPEWGKLWMIKPLLLVAAAGACGGAVYFFFDQLRYRGKWNRLTAVLLSLLIYIVGLFLGTVLGLDGTLWD